MPERWERSVTAVPPLEDAADVYWVNDALKPFLLALPPRRAAELALAVAEAVDRKVAAVSDDLLERNDAAGSPLNMRRAEHRGEHFREIEHVLGS